MRRMRMAIRVLAVSAVVWLCAPLMGAGEGPYYFFLMLDASSRVAALPNEATVRFCGLPIGTAGHADRQDDGRVRVTVFLGDEYSDLPHADASWTLTESNELGLVDPGTRGSTDGDPVPVHNFVPAAKASDVGRAACAALPVTKRRRILAGEDAVRRLAHALKTKDVSGLRAVLRDQGMVEIAVEHSLEGEDEGEGESAGPMRLKSAAAVARWIKDSHPSGGGASDASVEARPLLSCTEDHCDFAIVSGILHNTFYLKRVGFTFDDRGNPSLTRIDLLDGD